MQVLNFTFNPFSENTFVLHDETNECVIVDPGCYDPQEKRHLQETIQQKGLKPVKLLNTHCHLDHIMGNKFVFDTWGLAPWYHREEEKVLRSVFNRGTEFGLTIEPSPPPAGYLAEGDSVTFGNTTLEVIFTPGHSPGGICFFHPNSKILIAGDVIFYGSIGRTDLPGGSYPELMENIHKKIIPLGDDVIVYSGHGPVTNIQAEKKHNPFLQ